MLRLKLKLCLNCIKKEVEKENWYILKNIDELDSPALVVFPERVKHNIRLAISMTGKPERLRPHVKTTKSKEVAELMMEAGINKFKCATIAEAEMLAQCDAADVLLAYQPIGPKLDRFASLVQKYPATQFSCLTDNKAAADEQSAEFAARHFSLSVYLDINTGMDRTGIPPGEDAIGLYRHCSSLKGIVIAGLHVYDGHLRDQDILLRKEKCNAAFRAVEEMKEKLILQGFKAPAIIAGGSPTFPVHAAREDVECSPGTFVYWDKGYSDQCPEQQFLPAAVLVTRVISLPAPKRLCLDLGHKSVAAENEINKRIFFLNGPGLKPISQSEEHLVVETTGDHSYKTGDVLYGLPYHICPTVALYESVQTVEEGKITGQWKNVARNRVLTI